MGAPDFRVPPGPSWFQMREGASPPPPGSLPVSIPKALSWKAWKSPTSSPDPMNSGFLGLVPPSPGRHKGPSLALRLQEAAEGFCPPSRQRHPSSCPCPAWAVSSWVRAVCPLPLQPRAKPGVSLARGGRVKALALQTRRQAPRLRWGTTAQKERGAPPVGPKGPCSAYRLSSHTSFTVITIISKKDISSILVPAQKQFGVRLCPDELPWWL